MITKKEFESYVRVQKSGVTNMFDVAMVCDLTGLGKEQVMEIIKTYSKLSEKYTVIA